jgi:hypothetical protein
MFPHIVVIKGDEKIAIYATRLMAENSYDDMVLEYSVFTSNKDVFRFIKNMGIPSIIITMSQPPGD